jgi:hypothetical protein
MAKFRSPNGCQNRACKIGQAPTGYLVLTRHPETGEAAGESFTHIKDAIARAAELIRDGYSVEIKSATSPAL